jgi:hypothetical protein
VSTTVDWAEVLLWSSATPDDEADVHLWTHGIAEAAERWQASRLGPVSESGQHDAHIQTWLAMCRASREAAE